MSQWFPKSGPRLYNFIFDVFGKKVPEPVTMGLMAMGLTGFAALRRRR